MTAIFLKNGFFDTSTPIIPANDRGLLLGDGLFETIRAYQGRVLFLERHWERFTKSAALLKISIHFSFEELNAHIQELLKKNDLNTKDARIRVTLTRGISENGLAFPSDQKPTLIISATAYEPASAINKIIISIIRRNEYSPLANIKSINYLDNILALQEAKQNNADDAVLLNTHDSVACSTTANIFMVHNNQIYTPRLKDGALPGIMRGIILELSKKNDILINEVEMSVDALKNADEIFITNSLMGIRPVLQLEDKVLESIAENSLTVRLQKILNEFIKTRLH